MNINKIKSTDEIVREFVSEEQNSKPYTLDLKSLGDLIKRIINSYEIKYD